jgi:N-acetylglucosaminyldiphosphoundecaprenol N-acetyl-beta-D-mannosaminyltransferase
MSAATHSGKEAPARSHFWWLLVGRVLSPASEFILMLAKLLPGGHTLRVSRGEVLFGRRTLVGPSRPHTTVNGSRILAGVFSDYDLAMRMNMELSAEELDADYLCRAGPKTDLAILLRSLWSLALDAGAAQGASSPLTDHFNLFGVIVNNADTPGILSSIRSLTLSHPNHAIQLLPEARVEAAAPVHVAFVNANNFNLALEREEYMKVLRRADLVLPDGVGVKIALQMAGGKLRKNLNGTDLIPHLSALFVKEDWPVFFLGASGPVLARAKSNLELRHPGLRIVGVHDGYFEQAQEPALCEEINRSGAIVLIIGMGTPRQELWAARNGPRLNVALILSMGGLLDFLGEKNRRAPLWMRQTGLEWVYRLLQEPGRMWKRYLVGNPLFLWRTRSWIRRRKTTPVRKGRQR